MLPNRLYQLILENHCDGIYFVDQERRLIFWNKAAEKITGYTQEEVLGQSCFNNILRHINKQGEELCLTGCPLHASIQDGLFREAQVFLRHKEGYRIPVTVQAVPICDDDDKIVGAVEMFTVTTSSVYQDDLVASLMNIAMTDQLTQLHNRRSADNFLEARFREFELFGKRFAVVFIDLDNFGRCNNTYGHEVGDQVLLSVAKSMRNNVRPTDLLCRWGGEEFLGIFAVGEAEDLFSVAEKMRILVANTEVVTPEGRVVSVTASVGGTLVCGDDTVESLINRGDQLMYQSKKNGKNQVTVG